MHTRLKLHRVNSERLIKEYIQRRLHFTLSRFTDRIVDLSVRISCSPNRADEVVCLVAANVRPFGTITAEALEADVFSAIDLCADRFARRCQSKLARTRDTRLNRVSIRQTELLSAA